jgi:drug/metabolite transporter (DMT)-like permease
VARPDGAAVGDACRTGHLQVTALGRAGEPAPRIVFYFSLGGLAAGALWMVVQGTSQHTPRGVALLAAIGLLATLAQMMMTRAYRIGTTLVNASLQYLGIVFSFVFGALLFDDAVSAGAVAGIVLIVAAGLYATALRARRQPLDDAVQTPPNDT